VRSPGGEPLVLGSLRIDYVHQGEQHVLRVRDLEAPMRRNFPGIAYYPIDSRWRVAVRLVPYPTPRVYELDFTGGATEPFICPGTARFEIDGVPIELEPMIESSPSPRLFVLFRDPTNGAGSYHAGRFLYAPMPDGSGATTFDFNVAMTPPCAFSPYVSCPLPPGPNRLPSPIEAGERDFHG
jgi:uncharacterized protein (DUF1684 family)